MSNKTNVPGHIAIIMDGNRRWAKKRGLPQFEGHRAGFEQFKKISDYCWNLGVRILTVYAFSIENWKRSRMEVSYLMRLFEDAIKKEKDILEKYNVKLNVIGQIERLPKNLKNLVHQTMEETKNNKKGILNLAISYGGRDEIINAVKKIIKEKIQPEKLGEKIFDKYLYTSDQPDPDLLIRTSGEMRISGFLPWQSVYSELYFSDKMWPEFTEKDLDEAIKEYQNRQRRFGK